MKILRWIDDYLEEYISLILLAIISCVMMIQIIMRYVFNSSLTWAEELCRYSFIWIAFLGIGYSIKKGTMLRIDIVMQYFPNKIKKIIDLIIQLITLVFFTYMFNNSIGVVKGIYYSGQISPANGIPMFIIYGSTSVGFLLAILRSIQSIIILLRKCNS